MESFIAFLKQVFAGNVKPTPLVSNRGVTESIVVPEGYVLKSMPEAKPALRYANHVFSDIPSLTRWLQRYASGTTTEIVVDVDNAIINTRLDPTSLDADAPCARLTRTVEFNLADQLGSGKPMTQKDAYRLFSRLRHVLVDASKVLAQLANLEVKTSGTFSVSVDPRTGAPTAKLVSQGAEYPVAIPTEIVVRCKVFEGTTFELDCILDVGLDLGPGGTPVLTFTFRNREEVLRGAVTEAVRLDLVEPLGEGWLVGFGKLSRV